MKKLIKVGFCVAYDWEKLKQSIPRIYSSADVICLSLDKYRKSWSGNPYKFDQYDFEEFVQQVDKGKKIEILEDDFSSAKLNARQNCNLQRTCMADYMGTGGWHVQVDSDEYFVDFRGFVEYLKAFKSDPKPTQKAINICCPFIPLIKKLEDGYLFVDYQGQNPEMIPMATNRPEYTSARQNGHFNHYTEFTVFHETLARTDQELKFKLDNWGHAVEHLKDLLVREAYFQRWVNLDGGNFREEKDFHFAKPEVWPAINFSQGKSIEEFLENYRYDQFPFSSFQLWLKNNRNIARLQAFTKRILI